MAGGSAAKNRLNPCNLRVLLRVSIFNLINSKHTANKCSTTATRTQEREEGRREGEEDSTNGNIYKFSLRLSLDLYGAHILCIMQLVISALPHT